MSTLTISNRPIFTSLLPPDIKDLGQLCAGSILTQPFKRDIIPAEQLGRLFKGIQDDFNQSGLDWFTSLPELTDSGNVRLIKHGRHKAVLKYTEGTFLEGHDTKRYRDAIEFMHHMQKDPAKVGFHQIPGQEQMPPQQGNYEILLPHTYTYRMARIQMTQDEMERTYPFTKTHILTEYIHGDNPLQLKKYLNHTKQTAMLESLESAMEHYNGITRYCAKVVAGDIGSLRPDEKMKPKIDSLQRDDFLCMGVLDGLNAQTNHLLIAGIKTYPRTKQMNWMLTPMYDIL